MQMTYQIVHNFTTYLNMSLTHANEFLELKFKYEMQFICEIFKFLEKQENRGDDVISDITDELRPC